ncbi:hypothetical protein U1Q18_049819 [Sarracenia purpurea var. burkii]
MNNVAHMIITERVNKIAIQMMKNIVDAICNTILRPSTSKSSNENIGPNVLPSSIKLASHEHSSSFAKTSLFGSSKNTLIIGDTHPNARPMENSPKQTVNNQNVADGDGLRIESSKEL